jgi:predicted GIY-YIG superfamily endonuclease
MWHLYVLELEHGCYYVGIALNANKRFSEHCAGLGANFTRAHEPIRIVETFSCQTDDRDIAAKIENKKTLEYANRYGGDKVEGGKYFIPSKLVRKVRIAREAST